MTMLYNIAGGGTNGAIDNTIVAAQTGVKMTVTPFIKDRNTMAVCSPLPGGSGSLSIQGSEDNSTNWTTLCTFTSATRNKFEIAIPNYMRYNNTVAGTGLSFLSLDGVQ